MSETTDRRDARYRNYVIGWLSDSVNKTGGDPDELKTLRNDEIAARMLGVRDRLFKFHEPLKDQATVDQEVDALLGIEGKVAAVELGIGPDRQRWKIWQNARSHPAQYDLQYVPTKKLVIDGLFREDLIALRDGLNSLNLSNLHAKP